MSRSSSIALRYSQPATPPVRKRVGPHFHAQRNRDSETLWIELTGSRMIYGIASNPSVNSNGYSLSSKGCSVKFPIPLLSQHGHIGDTRNAPHKMSDSKIGEIVWLKKTADAIWVRAVIDHSLAGDHAWKLIRSGETRAFSTAAVESSIRLKGIVDGHRFFDRWLLKEVSVCRAGACPGATFDIYVP